MDNRLFDEWIEALESDKYQQGVGCLRNADKFCCLGVLCDISGDGKWRNKEGLSSYHFELFEMGYELHFSRLPVPLMARVGITSDQERRLMQYNDRGVSFRSIAGWLRSMRDEIQRNASWSE